MNILITTPFHQRKFNFCNFLPEKYVDFLTHALNFFCPLQKLHASNQ